MGHVGEECCHFRIGRRGRPQRMVTFKQTSRTEATWILGRRHSKQRTEVQMPRDVEQAGSMTGTEGVKEGTRSQRVQPKGTFSGHWLSPWDWMSWLEGGDYRRLIKGHISRGPLWLPGVGLLAALWKLGQEVAGRGGAALRLIQVRDDMGRTWWEWWGVVWVRIQWKGGKWAKRIPRWLGGSGDRSRRPPWFSFWKIGKAQQRRLRRRQRVGFEMCAGHESGNTEWTAGRRRQRLGERWAWATNLLLLHMKMVFKTWMHELSKGVSTQREEMRPEALPHEAVKEIRRRAHEGNRRNSPWIQLRGSQENRLPWKPIKKCNPGRRLWGSAKCFWGSK